MRSRTTTVTPAAVTVVTTRPAGSTALTLGPRDPISRQTAGPDGTTTSGVATIAELHPIGGQGARALARGIRVSTLGGFALHRDGVLVAVADWGSRKPRELLQVLLARQGQRVPRGVLADILWPDQDLERVSSRLSVALSTLRGVLDPQKRHPADHFVRADPSAVWLEWRHLDVDLRTFTEAMTRARAALAADHPAAERVLEDAAALYTGEFLADVPYEDWAVPAREEARALYLHGLRELVRRAAGRGAHDAAVWASLRLLAEDPFDEDAHTDLVAICSAAGRHGEARRFYRHYVERMQRLGISPMPFPGVQRMRVV